MKKSSELNIEERLCEYLKMNYRGSGNQVSSKQLEAFFHVKGTEIRRMVNSLRCKGEPICSDYYGYYYAANQLEINATIAQLNSRIRSIADARDGLLNRADDAAE